MYFLFVGKVLATKSDRNSKLNTFQLGEKMKKFLVFVTFISVILTQNLFAYEGGFAPPKPGYLITESGGYSIRVVETEESTVLFDGQTDQLIAVLPKQVAQQLEVNQVVEVEVEGEAVQIVKPITKCPYGYFLDPGINSCLPKRSR